MIDYDDSIIQHLITMMIDAIDDDADAAAAAADDDRC